MIAGELDLELPPVSFDKITQFLLETEVEHTQSEITSIEERIYKHRNNRKYPWQRRVIESNNNILYPLSNEKYLKEVYEVVKLLPIRESSRNIIMIYQEKQINYDFNFHYDADIEFGFRIGYNLEINKTFVELARLQEQYLYIREARKKIEEYMIDTTKVYKLVPLKSNTVLLLNGTNYPHRVPIVNSNERVVFIVNGLIDHDRFSKINYRNILEP